jgi:hypothetical protein
LISIVLCIDDFATPARQAFLDLAIKHGDKEEYFKGGYQSWVEWRSPGDVCGPDVFLEVLDIVHSDDVIAEQNPYPGSVDVVNQIAEQHEVFYISNRRPESALATEKWLQDNEFPTGELIAMMDNKAPYLSECQYLIDDRAKTLVQFVEDFNWKYTYGSLDNPVPRMGFGLMFDYNRALTDVPGIYLAPTWGGIEYYLKTKGVLSGRSISTGSPA